MGCTKGVSPGQADDEKLDCFVAALPAMTAEAVT
jgi:hypothetical protein